MAQPITLDIEDDLISEACAWLRISEGIRDDEIIQTAGACLIDLYNSGLSEDAISLDDPAIKQAIKLYLKAQMGYDSEADRFWAAYDHLRCALALSGDYNSEDDE